MPKEKILAVESEIRTLTYGFFGPIFFFWVGADTNVNYLLTTSWLVLLVIAVAYSAKILASYLVGKKDILENELNKYFYDKSKIEIVHASETISMSDSPSMVAKTKKDSSLVKSVQLQKEGKVSAVVSAGNTGAMMAVSLFSYGRIKNILRPAIALTFPTINDPEIVLDVGANVDCKPVHLFQFALMGSIYAYKVLKKREPRVALLNIGSEENKGNDLLIETFKLLKSSSLNFVGNIEGKDIISGKVEVVVCDGFVGNVILKFAERFAITTLNIVRKKAKRSFLGLGGLLSRGWLKEISSNLDYAEYGGVPLLGINGICIIAHGASSSKAIKNAILVSFQFNKMGVNKDIENTLLRMQEVEDGY